VGSARRFALGQDVDAVVGTASATHVVTLSRHSGAVNRLEGTVDTVEMLWVVGAIMVALMLMLMVGLALRPNDGKQSPTGSREGPSIRHTSLE
jgi:hypothetical protein